MPFCTVFLTLASSAAISLFSPGALFSTPTTPQSRRFGLLLGRHGHWAEKVRRGSISVFPVFTHPQGGSRKPGGGQSPAYALSFLVTGGVSSHPALCYVPVSTFTHDTTSKPVHGFSVAGTPVRGVYEIQSHRLPARVQCRASCRDQKQP